MVTAKSVFSVDVNDEQFKAFLETLKEYRTIVAELPDAWKTVGEASEKASSESQEGFQILTAALLAVGTGLNNQLQSIHGINAGISDQLKTMHKLRQQASQTSGVFGTMAKHTKNIARDLKKSTVSLLKLGALIGTGGLGIAGLLGFGSFFGIEKLAQSAYSIRRSSQGLDVTPAEQQAFSINYERYFDPTTVLTNVANAKNNLQDRWAFGALGINDVDQQDAAQLSIEATIKAKKLLNTLGPHGLLNKQWADATGLSTFFSLSDLRRLQATPLAALEKSQAQTASDTKSFTLSPNALLNWTNFNTELQRSATLLKDRLIVDLNNLTGPLTNLTKAVSDVLAGALGNPALKKDINDLASALEKFAGFVGTPQFADDVKNFVTGVSTMGDALISVVTWLGDKFPHLFESPEGPKTPAARQAQAEAQKIPIGKRPYPKNPDNQIFSLNLGGLVGLGDRGAVGNWNFAAPAKMYDIDPRLLKNIKLLESGTRGFVPDSATGAQGVFQMEPGTAREYGVKDPYDVGQEAYGAASYLNALLTQFHNNVKAAAAAYNWGPGKLTAEMHKYGKDWFSHLPAGVQDYANKAAKGVYSDGRSANSLTVNVNNATGGSAIVSTTQVANQSQ